MVDEARFKRAVAAARLLSQSNIMMHPQSDLLEAALDLAKSYGISVYDAVYLALAKSLGVPLFTLDKRQASAARKAQVAVLGGRGED